MSDIIKNINKVVAVTTPAVTSDLRMSVSGDKADLKFLSLVFLDVLKQGLYVAFDERLIIAAANAIKTPHKIKNKSKKMVLVFPELDVEVKLRVHGKDRSQRDAFLQNLLTTTYSKRPPVGLPSPEEVVRITLRAVRGTKLEGLLPKTIERRFLRPIKWTGAVPEGAHPRSIINPTPGSYVEGNSFYDYIVELKSLGAMIDQAAVKLKEIALRMIS